MLELLKDDLEDDQAGLPADFKQIPSSILEYMVSEAGEDRGDQIKFFKEIMEAMEQIAQSNNHSKASLDEGGGQQQEARKTQGTLPGAQEASPTEEAAIEPAMAGRDKEGAQSLSVAPTRYQETALCWSCSRWRGSVTICSKQYHQRFQTTERCEASNHSQGRLRTTMVIPGAATRAIYMWAKVETCHTKLYGD